MENYYRKILEKIADNQPVALETVITGEEGSISTGITRRLTEVIPVADSHGRRFARVTAEQAENQLTVREPILPQERLIVLGGGHIALPVCRMGAECGFNVCVVDDRPDFANAARFPEASRVICDSFENGIRTLAITPFDYVVVITRGHRHDADCLRVLLPGTEPAYLGMMGSKRRVAFVREKLLSEGADPARLERLYSPIGFKIGGIGPDEIAVSIIAEVISVRRLGRGDKKVRNRTDLDLDVLNLLAGETDVPKAVATVISSKGSSPRGAGAKMIIYRDGRLVGSIGGGCSEAEVLGPAREMIGTGTYRVFHVDMTAEEAEDEGSVCGGVMDILVEDVPVNQ